MLERSGDLYSCPLAYAVSLFEGKWKPSIIWHIGSAPEGSIRYGALKRSLPKQLSHKMLIQRLHELEDADIVKRTEFDDEKTPHVEYSLTNKGSSLASVMYIIRDWGAAYGDFPSSAMMRTKGRVNEDGTVTYARPKVGNDDGFAMLDRLATGDVGITWDCDYRAMVYERKAEEAEEAAALQHAESALAS